ncbi:MAG: hypothetical protein AAGA87_16295 [Pseudomonadota bacterium]
MLLHISLMLLCAAMLIHFSRYWLALSQQMYVEYQATRLTQHLDWTQPRKRPRIGAAPRRS